MPGWTSASVAALVCAVAPLLGFAFAGDRLVQLCRKLPLVPRLLLPALFGVPYLIAGNVSPGRGNWMVLYFTLPVLVAILLWHARQADPHQQGDWRDFAILLILGSAVDLRWLEPAWPDHVSAISKLMLLDSGLYGFLVARELTGVGFDLRIHRDDVSAGLRELAFYAPIAVPLGLALGFLHFHARLPDLKSAGLTAIFTFLFIAVPEEIYFRGWMQNLLERRLGRHGSLILTAAIFGLAHFNKRSSHFNWSYVLMATIAGIFYGRAWRKSHRVAASSLTHAGVDTIWALWLT